MKIASKMVLDKDFWIDNTECVMKTAKGFTLIELLIVIAVLGILAVAVLSAINPIEQINRSRDTGSRSDAEQLLGAMDRYYATAGYYPWVTSAQTVNPAVNWPNTPPNVTMTWMDDGSPAQAVLNKLSAAGTGELKASFVNRITGSGYNGLTAYNGGASGNSTYVCFLPKSSAFKTEAGKRCDGGTPPDYPGGACPVSCTEATPDTCYSCLP